MSNVPLQNGGFLSFRAVAKSAVCFADLQWLICDPRRGHFRRVFTRAMHRTRMIHCRASISRHRLEGLLGMHSTEGKRAQPEWLSMFSLFVSLVRA
jgi:hypothetical protein